MPTPPTTTAVPAPTEARMVEIVFHVPVPRGALVERVARIASAGRSAMQVDVEMHTEDLLTGAHRLATRGGFTMIALDPDGQPTPIRPLQDPTGHDWTPAHGTGLPRGQRAPM